MSDDIASANPLDHTDDDEALRAPFRDWLAARWSHVSDLEVGVSALRGLASDAIETDAGTEIKPRMFGVDATLRLRDDETNVGSWLLSAADGVLSVRASSCVVHGRPALPLTEQRGRTVHRTRQ